MAKTRSASRHARITGPSSVFHRAANHAIMARQHQVNRYVNGVLLLLDDESLASHGFERCKLQKSGTGFYPF